MSALITASVNSVFLYQSLSLI